MVIRLVFLFARAVWTVKSAKKLRIFKFLFLFDFVVIFYSPSSCQLPAWLLFLIVLHNGVKKDSRDKGKICNVVSERRIANLVIQFLKETVAVYQ